MADSLPCGGSEAAQIGKHRASTCTRIGNTWRSCRETPKTGHLSHSGRAPVLLSSGVSDSEVLFRAVLQHHPRTGEKGAHHGLGPLDHTPTSESIVERRNGALGRS